ncbi:hypothetical protein E5983_07190 [Streptococcus danieliae]|uniref:Uncharacterized protein n=1 Tax=Streptococcus danieliae TaxID=747656 RepID=A0A7X3G957_9STRE|nr:hypothetical protein [Streptococcus danieliae]MVX59418.1 hypothetical protein [Streptococcus danieliae]
MRLKKHFVLLGVFLSLAGIVYGYTQYNLTRYSVYYASHMPRKKEAKPELIMALENLDWIDRVNTENVRFDKEDNKSIYIKKNSYFTYSIYGYGKGYYMGINKTNGAYFYNTDSTGKFVTYSSLVENKNEESLERKTLQEIEALLAPATQDIIEAQKTPLINLQKLFNQRYMSRFN